MNKLTEKYIKGRIKSFSHAFRGLFILIKEERNAQIYIVISILTVLLGFWLQISRMEWIAVCTIIGVVFAAEAFNTAIENLADYACNMQIHKAIKRIKDLGAAAVLITAIAAFIIGLIIFTPKLLAL